MCGSLGTPMDGDAHVLEFGEGVSIMEYFVCMANEDSLNAYQTRWVSHIHVCLCGTYVAQGVLSGIDVHAIASHALGVSLAQAHDNLPYVHCLCLDMLRRDPCPASARRH